MGTSRCEREVVKLKKSSKVQQPIRLDQNATSLSCSKIRKLKTAYFLSSRFLQQCCRSTDRLRLNRLMDVPPHANSRPFRQSVIDPQCRLSSHQSARQSKPSDDRSSSLQYEAGKRTCATQLLKCRAEDGVSRCIRRLSGQQVPQM